MKQDTALLFEKLHQNFVNDVMKEEDIAVLTQRLLNTRNPFKKELIQSRIDNLNHKSAN